MKTVDVTDGRCGSDDDWGIAVVARAPMSADLDQPLQDVAGDPDPLRGVACASTTIYSGFRMCSTHTWGQDQIQDIADFTYGWAQARHATIVGGDFNKNNRAACTTAGANAMRPIYYTERFGQKVRACGPGWNWSHEVDK